ncbi:hypothetical protein AUK22_02420 [bacterium CG2_30_54_10]|nr:MAG: hypothetical protein AUK22_02420 [bacterium CG2_30_54_10]
MHLFRFPGGVAGFSEKADGNLNLYDPPFQRAADLWSSLPAVSSNRLAFPRFAQQIHGTTVLVVEPSETKDGCQGNGDAVLTAATGVPVGVFTADCLPVLVAADSVVMAIHAGWKGTSRGITGRSLDFLAGAFPGALSNIHIFMGPCIGGCCLELGEDVVEGFRAAEPRSIACLSHGEKWHLDLRALNVMQCMERGVPGNKIRHVNDCTKCLSERYFSYRRQGGRGGSMFSFIARFPV